jgi:hypothetical protein
MFLIQKYLYSMHGFWNLKCLYFLIFTLWHVYGRWPCPSPLSLYLSLSYQNVSNLIIFIIKYLFYHLYATTVLIAYTLTFPSHSVPPVRKISIFCIYSEMSFLSSSFRHLFIQYISMKLYTLFSSPTPLLLVRKICTFYIFLCIQKYFSITQHQCTPCISVHARVSPYTA